MPVLLVPFLFFQWAGKATGQQSSESLESSENEEGLKDSLILQEVWNKKKSEIWKLHQVEKRGKKNKKNLK